MTIAVAPPMDSAFTAYELPLPFASTPAPVLLPVHEAPHWLLAGVDEEEAGGESHICRGID